MHRMSVKNAILLVLDVLISVLKNVNGAKTTFPFFMIASSVKKGIH